MAQPDDIDKLLREIDAMNSGAVAPRAQDAPAARPAASPAPTQASTSGSRGGRVAWAGVSAVGAGLAGGVVVTSAVP